MDSNEEKYITFIKQPGVLDELKARLALSTGSDKMDPNYGLKPDEVVKKFYLDQGIEFGAVDSAKVLAMVNSAANTKAPAAE